MCDQEHKKVTLPLFLPKTGLRAYAYLCNPRELCRTLPQVLSPTAVQHYGSLRKKISSFFICTNILLSPE